MKATVLDGPGMEQICKFKDMSMGTQEISREVLEDTERFLLLVIQQLLKTHSESMSSKNPAKSANGPERVLNLREELCCKIFSFMTWANTKVVWASKNMYNLDAEFYEE